MNTIEKIMERDLYMKLFIDKFFYTTDKDMYKINMYNIISFKSDKNSENVPDPRTIEAHLKAISELLKNWEYYKKNDAHNPVLNLGKEVFKNPKEKFFFTRLCDLLDINEASNLNDHEITPVFFPLYVALIASYSKKYDTFEKYKKIALARSRAIIDLMCAAEDVDEQDKNEKLYKEIPIDEIYDYALNYYFPTAMESYFDTLENHYVHPSVETYDKFNTTILQTLELPSPPLESLIGQETLTHYLSSSVKVSPNQFITSPVNPYISIPNYIDAETIAANFFNAYVKIYHIEQTLRLKLANDIDIETITLEQLGEKIDILMAESSYNFDFTEKIPFLD